ncbi:MAG: pyridine nucleotide-disulfide oxidoreductase [Acidobacteria bacterium RIFCSPLOWO2_12_FULL_68_19]|nr:MAG: pyridine nucleotide-disulfide oxidoreductase [Acidobacteria bacterium RIFCSPLOWO2_12_FULL_68_19]
MDTKTILILGGGIGGLATARALVRRLPRGHRIVLVERERDHVFAPSLLWLMVGARTPAAITRPLDRLVPKGVEVRYGEIDRIDPGRRTVSIGGESAAADFIVVALGAALDPSAVPGLADAGHNIYTLPGAQSLCGALKELRAGRLVVLTATPAYKCPAAPYEAAMLADAFYRRRRTRGAVEIEVYAAEPAPMGTAGPQVSDGVRQLLAERAIGYHPGRQVTRVDPHAKRLTFADGTEAAFDLLAYVPPHVPPPPIRDSGLAGESGWAAVDRHTLETRFPGVYAIGDVVAIPLAIGKPLPKAGVFAHEEGEVVARRIAHAVTGTDAAARFDGHGECFIEVGDGKAGFGAGDFYAEPSPEVTMHGPSRHWHLAKVLLEKSWLNLGLTPSRAGAWMTHRRSSP